MHQKIKICFFSGYFPEYSGGAEYQAFLLSRTLDRRKYDIFFISSGGKKDGLHLIGSDRVYFLRTINSLRKFGRYYFANYFKIKKILINEAPDIVYQRIGSSSTGILSYLSYKLGFRFIWSCAHNRDLQKFKLDVRPNNILNNIEEMFRIYGIKNTEKILLQTLEQDELLKKNFARQGIVLRNSHPVPRINPDTIEKKNHILWVANIKPSKNPEDFIRLAHALKDTNLQFIMIGRKGAKKYQQKMELLMEKQDNLLYLPGLSLDEVNDMIQESLLFVNTSFGEGFPNTSIQSWLRYVPVISQHVDPDGFIQKYQIGFFADGAFERMVDYVRNILSKPEELIKMGQRARAVAIEHFDIKKNHKLFLEIINS